MKTVFVFFSIAIFLVTTNAQSEKPWTEWSKKEAERVLNDSAWGQTYTEDGTRADTTVVTNTRGGLTGSNNAESGQAKPSTTLSYRARLLSAKPVREAFAKLIVTQQNGGDELTKQLQSFIDRDFGDYLIVAFSVEGEDARRTQAMMSMLSRLTKDILKDKAYLERGDGVRAEISDFRPPVADGMGAKFVFSKTLEGKPFLLGSEEVLKFVFQPTDKTKYSVRFKVTEMTYRGKLEY